MTTPDMFHRRRSSAQRPRVRLPLAAVGLALVVMAAAVNVVFAQERKPAQEELAQDQNQEAAPSSSSVATNNSETLLSSPGTLFGQVAKTVVYGGAAFARFNNRLLCPILSHETETPTQRENDDQPTLFVFNNPLSREHAYRIYADDDIVPSMVSEAQFDRKQMTVILVHGWLGGIHNEMWLSEAKNVALRAGLADYANNANANDDDNDDHRHFKRPQRAAASWLSSMLNATSPVTDANRTAATAAADPRAASFSPSSSSSSFRPNVIVVDWSELAQGSLYTATKNSLKVSRRLARLLEQLVEVGGLRPELMHCLGHSIGTHICGQAARQAFPTQLGVSRGVQQRRMGRITGLDPGGFCYELGIKNETTYPGLRPSDALLVDAYYSNRSPFGNKYQVAQYNVRINNGFFQEPCSVWLNPEVAREYFRAAVRFVLGNISNNEILTCDHYFGTRFAYQLPGPACSYVGYACDSYRNFLRGRCGSCNSPAQCYAMDFEYQRPNASVSHALEQIASHSSHLNGGSSGQTVSPIGGVPYENRRVYYMRVNTEEPYCSMTFRVRVQLDSRAVNMRSFRTEWLKLRLMGPAQRVIRIKDGSSGRTVDALSLHGPWPLETGRRRSAVAGSNKGELNNGTLTALFELKPEDAGGSIERTGLLSPFEDAVVIYDNESNRQQPLLANPVESIQIDYLSSSNKEIRLGNSRSFRRGQFKVQFRHLRVKDDSPAPSVGAIG